MSKAIKETERRRTIQSEHNKCQNIEPKGINKKVMDIMEGASSPKRNKSRKKQSHPLADVRKFSGMSETELFKEITKLEKKMTTHAMNLEFEAAASTRDQIKNIKTQLLSLPY